MSWKYINPRAAAEPQHATASSPPPQHLAALAKSSVCVSEKLDSAVWEHTGWRDGRRCRQDAQQPQRHSWNSSGVRPETQATCSGEQALTAASSQHQLLEAVGNDLQRWQTGICFAPSGFPFESLGLLPEQSICTHTCIA